MDGTEFPDELDLALQQKLFIVRLLLTHYRTGSTHVVEALRTTADETLAECKLRGKEREAFKLGYVTAVRLAEEFIAAVDIEDTILDAQSKTLRDHHVND